MASTIERIVATSVVVPANPGYVDRDGFGPSIFDRGAKWIIELHSSDGLVGFGETYRGVGEGAVRQGAQQLLGKPVGELHWGQVLSPDWSDSDMFGHKNPPVPHRLDEREPPQSPAYAGFECAAMDLLGKRAGVPVHVLLGGAIRSTVSTSWWVGRTDPAHVERQMTRGMELGFTGIKLKAAAEDDILGIVRAIKAVAGPRALVVVDPNRRFYRLAEAIPIARKLEEFENVVIEDPFAFDPAEWRLFRQKTTTPLAFHAVGQLRVALAEGCCDYVNVGIPALRFLGDAHMAAQFGVPCWHGSGLELGLLDAYLVHCSSVPRLCTFPGDAMGHRIRCDDLIEEELEIRNGAITVPRRPGLGVTLDRKAMQRFAGGTIELRK